MPELRLGDIIDDYCTRCKLLTNHSIMALVNGEPAKVHCRTCYHEHPYRHAKVAPKKQSKKKAELFGQVLSKITGGEEAPPHETKKPET
jgi:hypothetical protein